MPDTEILAFAADLCDRERTGKLVEQVLARFGGIDIPVNNAGMTKIGHPEQPHIPLAELREEDWDYGIAINLKTTFNVTRAVLPSMLKASYGRVINISSTTGPLVSNPGATAYSAAKAAGWTYALPGSGGGATANHRQRD